MVVILQVYDSELQDHLAMLACTELVAISNHAMLFSKENSPESYSPDEAEASLLNIANVTARLKEERFGIGDESTDLQCQQSDLNDSSSSNFLSAPIRRNGTLEDNKSSTTKMSDGKKNQSHQSSVHSSFDNNSHFKDNWYDESKMDQNASDCSKAESGYEKYDQVTENPSLSQDYQDKLQKSKPLGQSGNGLNRSLQEPDHYVPIARSIFDDQASFNGDDSQNDDSFTRQQPDLFIRSSNRALVLSDTDEELNDQENEGEQQKPQEYEDEDEDEQEQRISDEGSEMYIRQEEPRDGHQFERAELDNEDDNLSENSSKDACCQEDSDNSDKNLSPHVQIENPLYKSFVDKYNATMIVRSDDDYESGNQHELLFSLLIDSLERFVIVFTH